MVMTPAALMERVRSEQGRKAVRFVAVSAINVPLGQAILWFCVNVLDWPGTVSNFVAVTITTIPAYLLTRYWVWGKKDKNRFTTEVLPFWIMALVGLILSTLAVAWVETFTDWKLAVNIASLSAFGVIWIAKFLILDRVMFGRHHYLARKASAGAAVDGATEVA